MTARQPRRTRRRSVPAAALPRPLPASGADETGEEPEAPQLVPAHPLARRYELHRREHHVTKDYSYVHRDLLTVACIGVAVIGFIVAMSFVL